MQGHDHDTQQQHHRLERLHVLHVVQHLHQTPLRAPSSCCPSPETPSPDAGEPVGGHDHDAQQQHHLERLNVLHVVQHSDEAPQAQQAWRAQHLQHYRRGAAAVAHARGHCKQVVRYGGQQVNPEPELQVVLGDEPALLDLRVPGLEEERKKDSGEVPDISRDITPGPRLK